MKTILSTLAFCGLVAAGASASAPRDLMTDTWVATDALGREMPGSGKTGLPKTDKERLVGIFYITWHGEGLHNRSAEYRNVSDILEADPQARHTDQTGLWGEPMGSYHWGEPEAGYFLSQDPWVMRRDISMLTDAGVDVLILDVTNAVHYWKEWDILFDVMHKMQEEGNKVPKICFWTFNGPAITRTQQLYEHYYKPGLHKDLWFYWDGKPLMLCNMIPSVDANSVPLVNPNPNYDPAAATDPNHPHYGDPDYTKENYDFYSREVQDFFTMRNMWWGYAKWNGLDNYDREDSWWFGYEMNDPKVASLPAKKRAAHHGERLEEMAVTPAQHPISLTGKSWRPETGNLELDDCDMPSKAYVPWLGETVENPSGHGIYFQDRWDEALTADPDFIYINDWNEWTAGKYRTGFDPGGIPNDDLNSFLGRKGNTFYFVDQYNAEFNRSIQPVKGLYTDNYYMQMAQNIRRYKGCRPVPELKGCRQVKVDGDFSDWSAIPSYYFDPVGDTEHRNAPGYAGRVYTDYSGRNDIVESKVAVGAKDVAFYVRTDSVLTPSTDPNWMLLLIDADNDHSTGWNGYDLLINKEVKDGRNTALMSWDKKSGQWTKLCNVPYRTAGNELELTVPRKYIGFDDEGCVFDFKWADNPAGLDDIITVCTTGDTAPNRRFNYRCIWKP